MRSLSVSVFLFGPVRADIVRFYFDIVYFTNWWGIENIEHREGLLKTNFFRYVHVRATKTRITGVSQLDDFDVRKFIIHFVSF
jgi:hypothetical protein